MSSTPFLNQWFRDPKEETTYINETAVSIRAGFLIAIPLYMLYTLIDVIFGSNWVVPETAMITDTGDIDFDGRIIYTVEALRRTYDYTVQTWVLFYALFEMLAGMFVTTSRLSPTIWIASFLARNKPVSYKPLNPKRMAWSIGALMIIACLVFFNPDSFARLMNTLFGLTIVTDAQVMPLWIPLLVFLCLGFMWMEAILGFCVGCKLHALLVKVGIFKEECEACNNIDWEAIAARHKAKQTAEQANSQSPS